MTRPQLDTAERLTIASAGSTVEPVRSVVFIFPFPDAAEA